MIGHNPADEIERALAELTEEQEDELDEAMREQDSSLWSHKRCLRWMWQEAIRRGWLRGPA